MFLARDVKFFLSPKKEKIGGEKQKKNEWKIAGSGLLRIKDGRFIKQHFPGGFSQET